MADLRLDKDVELGSGGMSTAPAVDSKGRARGVGLSLNVLPEQPGAGGGCCSSGGHDHHEHGSIQAYGDVFADSQNLPYGSSQYVGMMMTTKDGGRRKGKREAYRGDTKRYDSRTEAPELSTARQMGKDYHHEGAISTNALKSSTRTEDGYANSHLYANDARAKRGVVGPRASSPQSGRQDAGATTTGRLEPEARKQVKKKYVDMDYHHPLEDLLDTRYMRKVFGYISKTRASGKTMIEEIIQSYANPAAPFSHRLKYWPFHLFINKMKGGVTAETFRKRIGEHASSVRGMVIAARSVAEFGLTLPQRFTAPLFIVWNFTNLCNLKCKHCYQDAEHKKLPDELTLEEKLRLVDQIGEQYVPMIAFAGGEPTISPDLMPVLERCHSHGIHTTIATHGGTMTPKLAKKLADSGVRYVEISLDSVYPARHDEFRGQLGMWHRTVEGMRNVVKQEGLRLGVAMCVHQGNYPEVDDMLDFCCDIGAGVFAHFNFIPVGRGLQMVDGDLNPRQREVLLRKLNEAMQSGRIGVISTAPQFGRTCVAHAPTEGKQACSHAGSGGGEKARVIAKYLGGCGAGRDYVAIEPNGNITPCVYLPHRVQGNIRQREFIDIFRHNEFWELLCDRDRRTHHCEVCEFKHYCGGCRARADAYFGDLNAGDPGCIFNEKHWDDLVARGIATDPEAAAKTPESRQHEIDELLASATGATR